MKHKLSTIFATVFLCFLMIFGFAACGDTISGANTSGITFKTLSVDGINASATFNNATTEFSFTEEIETIENTEFFVSKDQYGAQIYSTKIVPLEEGDNIFYILETVEEKIVKTYTVTLRRRPIYTVSFEGDIPSQKIEEGETATVPEEIPTKKYYTFANWDFDFSTPITSNLTITANWEEHPEKIFILDASAAMRSEYDGTTRFERAVENIRTLSSEFFQDGGTITLIFADDQPEFIAERVFANNKEQFFPLLDALLEDNTKCSYGSADIKAAMSLAEGILEQNPSAETLLYTGTEYTDSGNVTVINVANANEWNAAILNANTSVIENYYTFEIDVACYGRDREIQLNVDVYGANDMYGSTFSFSLPVGCEQNETIKVVFINEDLYNASSSDQENTVYYLLSDDERLYSFQFISVSISENDCFIDDNLLCLFPRYVETTVAKQIFEVGEEITINSKSETVEISGPMSSLAFEQFPATFKATTPGTYTLQQELISGGFFGEQIFIKIPSLESNICKAENVLPRPNQVVVKITVDENEEESRIVKVEPTKNRVDVGKTTTLQVFLKSTYEGPATLTVYNNEKVEKSLEIELIHGSQMLELDYVFPTGGLYNFTFDITKNDGTLLTKNNEFDFSIDIKSTEKILILERNTDESQNLYNILAENKNYQLTVLNILKDDIPCTLDELSLFDQVILVNIANADMPEGFDEVLQSYVYDIGGSLFTVGGNDENGAANAYDREDMYGTLYQQMLPVQAIDYTPPVGVVFIIDTSASMSASDAYGDTYFDLAKASMQAGLDALSERDFVGIVSLSSNANIILPMTSRMKPSVIRSAIQSLKAASGGTVYSDAIEKARQLLVACDNLAKYHIIMLSDGLADSDACTKIIQENYTNYKITFSMIQFGGYRDVEALQNAVKIGHGRWYTATTGSGTPVRDDLYILTTNDVDYEPFSITLNPEYTDLFDISVENLPMLDGFYGTKLQNDATAILTGIYGVPIYAQWNYGKGKVGSFMCDLNGTFSKDLLNDENGIILLNKIICGVFSKPNAQIENSLTTENPPTETKAFKVALDNGEVLELILEDENNSVVQTIILNEDDDLEKEIEWFVSKIGSYTLKCIKKDASGNIVLSEEFLISLSE